MISYVIITNCVKFKSELHVMLAQSDQEESRIFS